MTEGRVQKRKGLGGAGRVASGMLSSRLLGLVRDVLTAFFFGVGPYLDVVKSAFRGPNFIQNLLGEQTLSAAFIPIYSRLLGEGRSEDASRFAGAIFGLLLAVAAGVSLLGFLLAEPFVALVTPGYLVDGAKVAAGEATVDRFELAVKGVRILFPMVAFLVLSSWALGVLNSHRRFFLSYFAPVVWNAAIIGGILFSGWDYLPLGEETRALTQDIQGRVLMAAFWGGLLGGLLQFLVQLPTTIRLLGGLRLSWSLGVEGVSEAIKSFGPVLAARGAAQLNAWMDQLLASILVVGAVGAIGVAQVLYFLPMSLFALSIAAAELPELSRRSQLSEGEVERRTRDAIRRISFFVIPTQVGYLAFGSVLVSGLFRRGQFQLADSWLVALILAPYAIGLLPSSWSRMLTNVFWAGGDTRTPARIAIARIVISVGIGASLMIWLDRYPLSTVIQGLGDKGQTLHLGAVGLAVGSAVASWFEWFRFRAGLHRSGWDIKWPTGFVLSSFGRTLPALAAGGAIWFACRSLHPILTAVAVLIGYAATYLVLAKIQSVPEADELGDILRRGR